VNKLESLVSGMFSVFIRWFVYITSNGGELVTRKSVNVPNTVHHSKVTLKLNFKAL
jgi:hypothetical protein